MEFLVLVVYVVLIAVIAWASQMGAMHLMQRFADLTLPEFKEWSWRVVVMISPSVVFAIISVPFVGTIISIAVYWVLMKRWFDADFMAIIMVGAIRFVLTWMLSGVVFGLVLAILT